MMGSTKPPKNQVMQSSIAILPQLFVVGQLASANKLVNVVIKGRQGAT